MRCNFIAGNTLFAALAPTSLVVSGVRAEKIPGTLSRLE